MTTPVYVSPTPDDLGLYMNDTDVYAERAAYLIGQAETLCLAVVTPLPVAAVVVVTRVAHRAYVGITSSRAVQAAQANNPYGMPQAAGGVYLERQDEDDLLNFAGNGGSGMFTVDTLPADYTLQVPFWDQGAWPLGFGV